MHIIHKELNQELFAIYKKENSVFPAWDVIADVAEMADIQPTFENLRYATMLFYVIEDLFQTVKHIWITYESVNKEDKTVILTINEMFKNKVGIKKSDPVTHKPSPELWDFYTDKTLNQLNENPNIIEVSKFEWLTANEKSDLKMETTQQIHNWTNIKIVKENYRKTFEKILNKKIPRTTFERFIERVVVPDINSGVGLTHKAITIMPEFQTEIRETYGKEYVKVFLKDKTRLQETCIVLRDLPSVRSVNITENKETDLTVYPNKVYSGEEVEKEVKSTLKIIFETKAADPVILADALSDISQNAYQKILNLIYYFGKNLEKYKSLHSKFDEEGFREFFLPYLNSMSPSHSATGETFNKIGKTDILIQNQKGENVFIAECKVWGGEGQIHPALDQLFERYVTWRDEKLAFIIFNKTVQGFSGIIDKAIESIKKHPLFKTYNGKTNDSSASFIFKHPEDADKEVKLELIMFNCA